MQVLSAYQVLFCVDLCHGYRGENNSNNLDQGGNSLSSTDHYKYLKAKLKGRVQNTLGEYKEEVETLHILSVVEDTAYLDDDQHGGESENTNETQTNIDNDIRSSRFRC